MERETYPNPEASPLAPYFRRLAKLDTLRSIGTIKRAVGLVIESQGPAVSVGELCYLEGRGDEVETSLEVIGFRDSTVLLMPLGQMPAVRAGDCVAATGTSAQAPVGPKLLGRIINALGQPLEGLVQEQILGGDREPGLLRLEDHLDAQDRVPAEVEEIIVYAHLLDAKGLGPDPCKDSLPLGAGGGKGLLQIWPRVGRGGESAAV